MPQMRYAILQLNDQLEFVEMPSAYMYQLTALNLRLHKEVEKLTADHVPGLPKVIAECENLELIGTAFSLTHGLDYMNKLEQSFTSIQEKTYPIVSLLTEIRALQAQLEQWYEEEFESQS
ncbi:hydrolase/acyltransferase [Paenibacillus hexagrammi]|uniref:Hydrolase/acyltransferase n=1 Tax=Paenibacillus hexagrammi TaxID=2908839 RepID=A0ABY3SKP5_9BACL|nr:hydrolase/acyltransferase [Paenibacillus sp. YPD9-1]UJF34279.1 hydrolase/acyltransferase [Paenibacillus sp. YPD9-1]